MTDHERGQIDTSGAEVYDSLFVPAVFGRFAEPVADLVDPEPTATVVDIACGTGALTRALAARTSGTVVGVDINPGMLAVAARHGGDIEYRQGDATDLPFADASFDIAASQFGLMFVTDPTRALVEMRRVAGRRLAAVWSAIEDTGWAPMQELLRQELGDDAAAALDYPFAMGVSGVLESILEESGASDADIERIEGTGRFDSIAQWVTTEVRGWTLGDSVSDEQLAHLITLAEDRLAQFVTDDGVVFPMVALAARW